MAAFKRRFGQARENGLAELTHAYLGLLAAGQGARRCSDQQLDNPHGEVSFFDEAPKHSLRFDIGTLLAFGWKQSAGQAEMLIRNLF